MTRAEQETIIRWDEQQQLVEIYSASPIVWARLARLGFEVRAQTTYQGKPTGRFYQPVPLAQFRYGKKRRVSEAQLRRLRERGFLLRSHTKQAGADDGTGLAKGKGKGAPGQGSKS